MPKISVFYLFVFCIIIKERMQQLEYQVLTYTPLKNCGISKVSSFPDRIVGGREAVPGEFPWLVSLQYKVFLYPTHLCGAAILNEYWILTAAHCVYKRSKRKFSIVVGLHSQDERNVLSYAVDKIIMHKNFVYDTFLNDIALIRVTRPIPFNERINGICLPQAGKIASGIATAAGWGALAEDDVSSIVVMAVNLPIVSQPVCEALFEPIFYSASAMICAGYPEGGRDTCQGDSGGPLVQRVNGSFTVIGIVSFGVGCARPQLPGIYTNVANYISWINANAK